MSVKVHNQTIVKFLYTEQRSTWMGVTSMSTLVHKRRNSSDTENSLAIHRTTLLLVILFLGGLQKTLYREIVVIFIFS